MKMETPNKLNARNTSNTLKQHLQNEAYLRALEMMERIENATYKNGYYGSDD
jgi:hypothetical protein